MIPLWLGYRVFLDRYLCPQDTLFFFRSAFEARHASKMPNRMRILNADWMHNQVETNELLTRGYQVNRNTALVRFTYGVYLSDGSLSYRVGEVLLDLSNHLTEAESFRVLQDILGPELIANLDSFGNYDAGGDVVRAAVDPATNDIAGFRADISYILNDRDVMAHLGFSGMSVHGLPHAYTSGGTSLFGYLDDQKAQHRAFRYMIEGCDMKTLHDLTDDPADHNAHCDRMCVYHMLADLNTPVGHQQPIKVFRPENVNQWLNQNGYSVGGLTDGVTSDAIQAHAMHFKYGHCAMDLTRSVVNLYVPFDRNHHYKTACYVITGDHCQPIVDANIVKSIMQSASQRLGRRNVAGYHHTNAYKNEALTTPEERAIQQQSHQRRKRQRSLDRIFRPEFEKSEDRQFSEQCQELSDLEMDDWEEEFTDDGREHTVTMGTSPIRRDIQLPLVTDTDRIHLYTLQEGMEMIQERCKPTYREGQDARMIHYYICTDQDDVEFLYQYLIRVLNIDPLRYARSFNGKCHQIRMQNTWWFANRDVEVIMQLHRVLHPKEPLRMMGLASYAFRMFQQELYTLTRKSGTVWECMSHYSPNLQRLLDTHHPYNRPKLLQKTWNPPFSNPNDVADRGAAPLGQHQVPEVRVLIPNSQRRRVDLIRSYASTIRLLENDEYPIHDVSNQVVTFDETQHGHIPIGHYLVEIPGKACDQEEEKVPEKNITAEATSDPPTKKESSKAMWTEDWEKLPCFSKGELRMMSHRMVRALLDMNLLRKSDIRLACPTDPMRQKKYGKTLVEGMKRLVERVYCTPELQDTCPKHIINHFVGLCNGTTIPHSGMRYVFRDIKHLVQLLSGMVSQDQLQRIRLLHTTGHDTLWHKSFSYYEIDSSGVAYRALHLQPVFNMVLEDQALQMFRVARPIPLTYLIQMNVDALEYRLPVEFTSPPDWCVAMETKTVAVDSYEKLSPVEVWQSYMGRFKAEPPKDASRAMSYYYKYNAPGGMHKTRIRQYFRNQSIIEDPEDREPVADWKNSLRKVDVSTLTNTQSLFVDMFNERDRAGLILTGAAGTGKTYYVKQLCAFALNLGHKVVKTAYTHAACVQLGYDAVTLHALFGVDDKTDVRAMMIVSHRFMGQLRSLDIDVLVIDEISMIPLNLLEVLSLFHRVSVKTRIICVGDFNQLPPVEPGWERNDLFNYFDHTDIYPYLTYDRLRNVPGRWMHLTECKRTSDPHLIRVAQNPRCVTTIDGSEFPMPSVGIPIWRFICWRNSTRKACNFYCGYRYRQSNPNRTAVYLNLKQLWVQKKRQDDSLRGRRGRPTVTSPTTIVPGTDVYERRYDTLSYRPTHWNYLQNYTYAVGMEVVCRNTIREYMGDNPCVNNRRALIVDIDTHQKTVILRWTDVLRRWNEKVEEGQDMTAEESLTEFDITLTYHDFAFNFVPGFCITTHMAQGETIREHYGILEWCDIKSMPRMAYVAMTRGESSALLHIVPKYADPWNSVDTTQLTDNVLRKLYHLFRWDKKQLYELDVPDVLTWIQEVLTGHAPMECPSCKVPILLTRYSAVTAKNQFALSAKTSFGPQDRILSCEACRRSAVSSPNVSSSASLPAAAVPEP